jgi:glycerol-3-phosphate dehydrogenase (NAD(P)+)
MKLAVIGAGAWGTALASRFSHNHQVTLHARDQTLAREITRLRENPRYLPGCALPDSLVVVSDFDAALGEAEIVVVATPLAGLRAVARALPVRVAGVPLVWACKGLEAGTSLMPHQIVAEELGAEWPCAALTGPSFAAEVARGMPTAVTLAAAHLPLAEQLCAQLHQPVLRFYANDDVIGAEVGGAVKNVMAIAVGLCDGLGFGLNARAALMTRGLAEIARLGLALGARRETFLGLAGMGDLILTCTGDLSRNRAVGQALARGLSLDQILSELSHVAEGVSTTRETAALAARLGVEMPITQSMKGILFDGLSAEQAVQGLLTREPRVE